MSEKKTKFRVEVGERLKRLRKVKDLDQVDIGQIIGMVPGGVSMIEQGQRGLDPQDAIRLKQAFGITLDWIYAGDSGALPRDLFKPLTAQAVPELPAMTKRAAK